MLAFATRNANKLDHLRSMAALAGVTLPSSKNLWDVMKRSYLEPLPANEIAGIWMQYHANPSHHRIAEIMSAADYTKFADMAARSPMFVLPVFKGGPNSMETYVLQCQLPHVLVTSLEDFNRHQSAAAPHFCITYYKELISTKDLVLIRGDIIQNHSLDTIQAMSILSNLHKFYMDSDKYSFVHAFNHDQSQFDYKRLLDSLGHDTSQLPM